MFSRAPNAAPDPSRRRADAVAWLRSLFPDLPLPPDATDEDLRDVVGNGRLLCALLRRLLPGALLDDAATDNAGRFRAAIQRMGVPTFSAYDLERGEMSAVVTCILALKDRFPSRPGEDQHIPSFLTRSDSEGSRRHTGGRLQRVLTSPVMSEAYSPSFGADAYSPSQVFQPKHGYSDLSGSKYSELMKSSSLENSPTQSLLGVVNSILDESIERKNGQIPYRIACLLRKVIAEIERRISTQAGHIRNQNNMIKAREEKYQSRIRVLEALAGGASGQTHVEKDKLEGKGQLAEDDMARLMQYEEDLMRLMKEKEDMVRLLKEKEDIIRLLKEKEDMVRLLKVKENMGDLSNDKVDRLLKERDDTVVRLTQEKEDMILMLKAKDDVIKLMKDKEDRVDMKVVTVEGTQRTTDENKDRLLKEKDDVVVRLMKEKDEIVVQMTKEKEDMIMLLKEKEDIIRLMKEKEDSLNLASGKVEDRKQAIDDDRDRLIKENNDTISKLTSEKAEIVKLLQEKDDLIRLMKEKEDKSDLKKGNVEDTKQSTGEEADRSIKEKIEIIRLTKEKEDYRNTIMKLKQEFESLRSSYEESSKLLESKKEDVAKLVTDKEMNDNIILQLRQELEATKRLHEADTKEEDYRNTIMKLKQEFESLRSSYEESCKLLESKKEDVAKFVTDKEINDNIILQLRQELEATKKLHGAETKEKEDYRNTIMKLKQEFESLRSSYEESSILLESKKEDVAKLVTDKEMNDNIILQLRQELEATKNLHGAETKEKEDYRNTITKLKQEFESLRSSYEESSMLLESKKEDVAKLVTDKEMNDSIILQLRQELEATKKLHGAETKEKEDYRNTIMKLKQEFESLRSSYEESSMLLESKKEDVAKLVTDKEMNDNIILQLRQELEATKKLHGAETKEKEDYRNTIMKLKQEFESLRSSYEESSMLLESKKEDVAKLVTDKEMNDNIILQLRQELEATKKVHEAETQQLETKAAKVNKEFEQRIKEIELMLEDSTKRRRELEESTESIIQFWKQKEIVVNKFVGLQVKNAQELRLSSVSVRLEILNCQKRWFEELADLGQNLKKVTSTAEKYHATLADNRKLFNEIQELKGNIRVYCRIRPFRPWEDEKSTSVEYIGENGELVLSNPTKKGKEAGKNFTFNKVFGPTATQDMVFKDIQPLIRSVLDGYNVCIFAYGQTGSGKTHTMMGPENATEKEWGVNYRALNDLFNISHDRRYTIKYELGFQMVEIYNEQIRDLLGTGGSQKKLGIQNTTQPNGLAVPDATMCPVDSTSHVIQLMQTGHNNRSMSATALNERSSRSHSVVTIHVQGQDLKTSNTLRGALHLVDLAGSERVDRSAVTGDRLKEAQHINKSLAALGDVIFSLSQKNAHVPYRNSKLTQVLQTSLGGHAKTLMFVQVNPDVSSYTETLSTLKFAERVSGVELGVARTNKEGKDVKELMDQLSLLKDTIAMKDDEIERLQLANSSSSLLKSTKHGDSVLKHSASSPGMTSLGKVASFGSGAASDLDNFSDISDRHSEAGSMFSTDEARQLGQNFADPGGDSDGRLSDVSDGGIPTGAETDSSVNIVVDQEQEKTSTAGKERLAKAVSRVQKPTVPKVGQASSLRPKPRDPPAPKSSVTTGARKSTTTQATPPARASSTSKRVP